MRKKWLKTILWLLLAPVLLFALLMISLYVPTVQDFIRKQATAMVSDATGMDISVERIDLRFPLNLLVRGVLVVQPDEAARVQHADTLLSLESLNVRVQAWPLLKGRIKVDDITLKQAVVNSSGLLKGMQIKGVLGHFFLAAHGIDLNAEEAVLTDIWLSDTHMQVTLADTTATAPEDTAKTMPNWKIALHALKLKNVSVGLQMPLDSLSLATRIADAEVNDVAADLRRQFYGWKKLLLAGASVSYDVSGAASVGGRREGTASDGAMTPAEGFDPSHIALRDIRLGIDSALYCGRNMNAVIRECSMYERSGLHVVSMTGRLLADSAFIRVSSLKLLTPHSEMDFSGRTYWEMADRPAAGNLFARFDARIGKQDVLLFAGRNSENFKRAYPFRPLVVHAGIKGNLKRMEISRFTADLPGAFSLNGDGELRNLTDSLKRGGSLDLEMQTQNLNFLTELAGLAPDGSVVVPDSMNLTARFALDGRQCMAALKLQEQEGLINLDAAYNLSTEAYHADLTVNALQVHHFLPKDSVYTLSASLSAKGQGIDPTSRKTVASLDASIEKLQYGYWNISGVDLRAALRSSVATVRFVSDNVLLKMRGDVDMRLDRKYPDGTLNVEVEDADIHKLGFAPRPLKYPFAFRLGAETRRDSVSLHLDAGDLDLRFRARSSLKEFLAQSDEFSTLLMKQLKERILNHADLRHALPSADMRLTAGNNNPVSYYLATKDVSFNDMNLGFEFTPELGINGHTAINGLRVDSLQLDTVFFGVKQDTTCMRLQGGVVNGPKNPQFVFRGTLTGEVRNEDAELTVNYTDEKGKTGVLLGLNARSLTEGHGKGDGLLLRVTPAEPIIAFRKFRFVDESNWIYLHKNMRVYANVDMDSDDGLCFRMQSDRSDTVSLQNINLELIRLRLNELTDVIPYMPRLTGLFSAEVSYVQTATSLQVSAEANIEKLTYERQPVGDLGLGVTWLPGEKDKHYLNTYFTCDNREVMTADGILTGKKNGKNSLEITTDFAHFPLKMANAFVPDRVVSFTGNVDGGLQVSGTLDKPKVNGDIVLDSVSVYARQAGARYWFDNRPLQIRDNRLAFDKFAIYTTSKNPLTIDGNINFRNLERPTANLSLLAEDYTLLDAHRTRESLIYGKVFVDLRATVRGPLDGLTMRGNMNLLGNTNVTYVLTDSPLTVEDRLDGLVSFTSFTDTASVKETDTPTMSLGGMKMLMSVHIDDAVRLRADLSPDRSKYIELEGGGDLNLQYTPQGDMTLTGRYTLSGGSMKYSLPVIPLKTFQFIPGSYVDWRGNVMNPMLNLKATERMRASVSDGADGNASRMVNFDVSISIKNRLDSPDLVFDISAPEDATVENELQGMGAEERSKQAIAMLATGIYLNSGAKGGGLTMGAALNSVLQSQINSLAGGIKNANISVGVEDRTSAETGDTQKDFSFRYSQRFFNDRVQIIIGGKVSTGVNATNSAESFIDNISLEYRLDMSGTRYVRVFHDKNYESVLDGEITETGVGLVIRKKMERLGELFIFRRKKKLLTE